MNDIQNLIETMKKRLSVVKETILTTSNNGSLNDEKKLVRLNTKKEELICFIVELEMLFESVKEKEVTAVKMMVVRGCFRGVESKQDRNYDVAINTVKEFLGFDYEVEVF